MKTSHTAFAAALSVLAVSPALAEPPSAADTRFDPGKYVTTLPQSSDAMQVSHALALACSGGAHHLAARLVMFVDKGTLAARFADAADQNKFLEQARFRAQATLRVMMHSAQWFPAAVTNQLAPAYNAQLETLGDNISKQSGVKLLLVATSPDLVPIAGPCTKLFDAPLPVSWPIIRALDLRNSAPSLPQPKPEFGA